jgi:tetratricopeptide (TPR) repeat protein
MRLHRIAPPFARKPHLDLYHPLVRLYRGAYADGRLGTFERELCGVEREDDLPGSLAPAAWFDFLGERPHRLEAVFRHNELDVLSLVTLAAHLGRARSECRADGSVLPGAPRARARAMAELHAARREHALALDWLERALTRAGGDAPSDPGELWFRHSECLRKLGERERALDGFLGLARERKDGLSARAWAEVARLARRLKRTELESEARAAGPSRIDATLTGRAHARARAAFGRDSAGSLT